MGLIKSVMRAAGVRVEKAETLDLSREATLDDGFRQVTAALELLAELDTRLAVVQRDLVGPRDMPDRELPDPRDIGLSGYVPRLMEASMYLGALTRRMHLRIGIIEAAIGKRRRPVYEDLSLIDRSRELIAQKKKAMALKTAARAAAGPAPSLPPPARAARPAKPAPASAKRPRPRPRPSAHI